MIKLFYIPTISISIPYNVACKINEFFNETLKMCVNNTINESNNILNETNDTIIFMNDENNQHRLLQRTGDSPHARSIRRWIPEVAEKRRIERFSNFDQNKISSNELYFFIFCMLGIISFKYSREIKKILKF